MNRELIKEFLNVFRRRRILKNDFFENKSARLVFLILLKIFSSFFESRFLKFEKCFEFIYYFDTLVSN